MLQPSVAADLVSPKNGSVGHSCDYFRDKGTLEYARWHSFRVTDHSFGPRPTKIGM